MEEDAERQRLKVVALVLQPTEEFPVIDDPAPTTGADGHGRARAGFSSHGPVDDRVLDDAVRGDASAFSALLRRYDDKMRGVVWRVVGSVPAMDDVLQEAYLKAWRALPEWRGESAFSSWLYTIVYRSAIDWHRRERRHLAVVPASTAPTDERDHAEMIVEQVALRDALASLPPDQLAVVALIDGEGRPYDEVAVLLDISTGTVGSRLHRARAALREHLGGAR